MANNITLSLLMRDSYNEDESNRGGKEVKALGFVKLDDGRDEDSGFQAQAYFNKDTQEIVLAVAGTNGSGDALADLNFGNSLKYHQQFQDGLEYASSIKSLVNDQNSDYFGYKVLTTGHSLGGGHAQILSHTFGWDGMTWDAPKASLIVKSQGYHDQLAQHNLIPEGVPDSFINYTEYGSLISALPPGYGAFLGREHEVNEVSNWSLLIDPLYKYVLEQHAKERSTDFFLANQNEYEIDGWHYVGGTYDGWYSEKPTPEEGQFDWAGRASADQTAELNRLRDQRIEHNLNIEQFKAVFPDPASFIHQFNQSNTDAGLDETPFESGTNYDSLRYGFDIDTAFSYGNNEQDTETFGSGFDSIRNDGLLWSSGNASFSSVTANDSGFWVEMNAAISDGYQPGRGNSINSIAIRAMAA